ncbi:helix-turn-helix transcriptional regulator [uncultured Phocaeicola sp.]|uniref:helix-turn-helix domain-containing protein n=1 Tax=uncultured Phocaeicola sp. TaxID=990718 RepID=UPI002638D497|nr:helix-turn-helix transcriptional regulator [uncultured Phocaeicola sp.]
MTINDNKFDIALANSGLSISEAAERANISRQRFCMILNQKRVTPQAAGKIAKALGVNVTEIIE